MTKNDFIVLGMFLRRNKPVFSDMNVSFRAAQYQWFEMFRDLTDTLERNYSNFDRSKFEDFVLSR